MDKALEERIEHELERKSRVLLETEDNTALEALLDICTLNKLRDANR